MFDLIGFAGTAMILLAYLLVQLGRLQAGQPLFSILNLLGAGGVIVSLTEDFNLPALVLEACWALISAYGLYRALARGSARA